MHTKLGTPLHCEHDEKSRKCCHDLFARMSALITKLKSASCVQVILKAVVSSSCVTLC